MNKTTFFLFFTFTLFSLQGQEFHFDVQELPDQMSVRAIEAWNDQVFWMGGDHFRVASSYDGGRTWKIDTLIPPGVITEPLQYRSIELLDDSTVLVLSAGSPGVLWKTSDAGQNWKIVWHEDHPGVFMDAIAFNQDGFGWMFGDPFDGAFAIYRSINRGEEWIRIDADLLPKPLETEGGFAASDQLIAFNGLCVFVATGGPKNRILRSCDQGKSWDWVASPLTKKGIMTGGMGITFKDESTGFIVGGDWEKPEDNTQSIGRTFDGGSTWVNFMPSNNPGHRTSIAFLPGGKEENNLLLAGRKGVDMLYRGKWERISDLGFYSVIPIPGSKKYLLSGAGIWAVLSWKG